MTISPGVWIIFHGGGDPLILGTPCGRQFAVGSSFSWDPSTRWSARVLAHGWYGISPGLRSAPRFWVYLPPLGSQMPERSGCPSGKRGAGAERFGLPLAPRGILDSGTLFHCA